MDASRLFELAEVAERLARSVPAAGGDADIVRTWMREVQGLLASYFSNGDVDYALKQKLPPSSLGQLHSLTTYLIRNAAGAFSGDRDGAVSRALNDVARALRQAGDRSPSSAGAQSRKKAEKFGVLDSPTLLKDDLAELARAAPLWGASILYLDIDEFKKFNTQFTERLVDKELLPAFQKLIEAAVDRVGYAYAEGGDEVVILLPNSPPAVSGMFAEELRARVSSTPFSVQGQTVRLTVSIGVASSVQPTEFETLPDIANHRKRDAKTAGRNRVVTGETTSPTAT